jgi:3-isopropylmalate dehydrogenase
MRQGKLRVVLKPGGIPAISKLWQSKLQELAQGSGLKPEVLEVDNAIYQVIANAQQFDVLVAPNAFGDILSDGASLLLGSRGLSYSGNFGTAGHAVYQTGHGAAHDLAGSNRANPIGQILSLAMMLRESFGHYEAAESIEAAIEETLQGGWRTADIAETGSKVIGTKEMGARIAQQLQVALESRTARA